MNDDGPAESLIFLALFLLAILGIILAYHYSNTLNL